MASISEMSKPLQFLGLVVIAAIVTAALYFGMFKRLSDQNQLDRAKLEARLVEVNDLRKYESNMPALIRQIETLRQQLEIQSHIVPDEKEADKFIHLVQNTAQSAGIEIRRWTAKAPASKEFYTEVPFDLELDGAYFAVLNFFDRVAKLERIINVSSLQLNAIKGAGQSYQYAPQESVVGRCTATTFFSHDPQPAAPSGKPGAPPPRK